MRNRRLLFVRGGQTECNCLNISSPNRQIELDILKTILIIAVVLYYLGNIKNGYLGVEIFFVVSSYNFAKKRSIRTLKKT